MVVLKTDLRAHNSITEKKEKNQNWSRRYVGRRRANFQLKRSEVRHQKLHCVYLRVAGTGGSGTDCKLGLTIVRPSLLLAPEMPGALEIILMLHSLPTSSLVTVVITSVVACRG